MAQLGSCHSDSSSAHDAVCLTMLLPNTQGALLPIWENTTGFIINGTIIVENEGNKNSLIAVIFVNGEPVLFVPSGETRSITLNDNNTIEVDGVSGTQVGEIKVSFSLNYSF